MTAAMFIAQCLKQEGVTKVFGQCGHTNYALIDACHRLGIEYVSFRHEQLAAHAADAYYRVSHKLAVLNVHLSPGLTNALTGVVHGRRRLHADGRSSPATRRRITTRASRIRASAFMPTRRRATSSGPSASASGASTTRSSWPT